MNSRTRNWACCAWCTALGFSFGHKANITSASSRRRTARIFVSPLLHNTAGACTVLLQYLALRVSLLLRVEPPKYIHTSTRRGLDLYFSQIFHLQEEGRLPASGGLTRFRSSMLWVVRKCSAREVPPDTSTIAGRVPANDGCSVPPRGTSSSKSSLDIPPSCRRETSRERWSHSVSFCQ